MRARFACLPFAAVTFVLFPLNAKDWPTFRGADRMDVQTETGLLKTWPTSGPKKLWVYDKAGLGYSGFAVVGDTLYTMGANDDGEEFLVAVTTSDGKEKWRAPVGPRYANKWGDGPRSSPTVDGDFVYALGGKGDLVCVGKADGKAKWKVNLVNDFGGKVQNWGYTESVLVDGDKLICTPGGAQGTVLALDKLKGTAIWQSKDWTDVAQYSSAIVADHGGKRQYIQRTTTKVAGIDASTGDVLWTQDFPAGRTAVIPTPIYKDGFVYVSAGYGAGCMLIDIKDMKSPKIVYENTNMVNHHGGVILVGNHLYGFSDKGGWTCQDFKTGEVQWQEKALGKGAIHCADGMLYLLEEKTGTVVLIEASPEGWTEKGRFILDPQTQQRSPDGRIWVHPVVSGGKLYLRDQELVLCYDVRG